MSEEKDVSDLLKERIIAENNHLSSEEIGSEGRKQVADLMTTLYKLRIEEGQEWDNYSDAQAKTELEKAKLELEKDRLALDKKSKEKELEAANKATKTETIRIWTDVGKTAISIAAWAIMSMKVMKFEETGTIRSKAFSGTIPILRFFK